ncbi:hypothetical protein FHS27_005534 [Rhodopirellula rubra]|uniref:Uncharacterized protein n=1 Tax=Aporhodopirellula rubra TaxID=980271 RepID=A0A7W5H8S3_9BACT|nr:hypothetical protein [Aporhodopirellula rubra]
MPQRGCMSLVVIMKSVVITFVDTAIANTGDQPSSNRTIMPVAVIRMVPMIGINPRVTTMHRQKLFCRPTVVHRPMNRTHVGFANRLPVPLD